MALLKKNATSGSHTLVTFTVDDHETPHGSQVFLSGEFNNWQINNSAFQMKKKGSSYTKQLKLENGKRYQFRYRSEENEWFNDSAADDYVASPYEGIQNCVVDLSAVPKKKKAIKKTAKKPIKKASTKVKAKKDDLKKIEGIGPKISAILTEKGIGTFKKLSQASQKVLKDILKEAGPRFSMHNPGTWPKQAKLADQGKWEKLKQLQDKLDGGKIT